MRIKHGRRSHLVVALAFRIVTHIYWEKTSLFPGSGHRLWKSMAIIGDYSRVTLRSNRLTVCFCRKKTVTPVPKCTEGKHSSNPLSTQCILSLIGFSDGDRPASLPCSTCFLHVIECFSHALESLTCSNGDWSTCRRRWMVDDTSKSREITPESREITRNHAKITRNHAKSRQITRNHAKITRNHAKITRNHAKSREITSYYDTCTVMTVNACMTVSAVGRVYQEYTRLYQIMIPQRSSKIPL